MPNPDEEMATTPWHKTRAKTLAKFENLAPEIDWWADFLELRELGYSWQVTAYIAWASSPKTGRKPETHAELADFLGVRPRTLRKWREVDETIEETVGVMQSAPLLAHRRDVIDALVAVAKDPDPKAHSDRKLFLEMTGDYKPRSTVEHDGRVNVGGFTADLLTQAEFELEEFLDEEDLGNG